MKRKIFSALLSLFAVAGISSAQTPDSNGFKSESEYRQKTFNELALIFERNVKAGNGSIYSAFPERRFIQKGDSTRIKFVFDPAVIQKIEIVDGPSAPINVLKKGEWVIVVKPQKSTSYVANFHFRNQTYGYNHKIPAQVKVLVLEPDKYKEVEAKAKEFYEKSESGKGLSDYLKSIDPEFQKRSSFPIYTGDFQNK